MAQEYFYGYDRTGGRTSGPDIKSFLAPAITGIAVTDQEFEPRFPIELAKAGDADTTGYFMGTPGRRLISWRRRSAFATAAPYTVECTVCGKRFPRKNYSTKLNAHKDQYGNPCFGRFGYMV